MKSDYPFVLNPFWAGAPCRRAAPDPHEAVERRDGLAEQRRPAEAAIVKARRSRRCSTT